MHLLHLSNEYKVDQTNQVITTVPPTNTEPVELIGPPVDTTNQNSSVIITPKPETGVSDKTVTAITGIPLQFHKQLLYLLLITRVQPAADNKDNIVILSKDGVTYDKSEDIER